MDIGALVQAQKDYFHTGATLPLSARRNALKRLNESIKARERELQAALLSDLNKSPAESYMCEVGMTLSELRFVQKHLARWMRDKPCLTPLAQFPAKSFTVAQPYGVTLVMSPWNYPFLLTMEPLIGAIAAGNCCVVKPSAYAPATSAVVRNMLTDCFPPMYAAVVEGGREENQALLDQKFDYIFFTGGVEVGKEVMTRAARHLTPVTLELGGKSPCIVDSTARLDLAAKRLVFGKLLNCGQTCVAPDYLLIDRRVKTPFLAYVQRWITVMYGEDPLDNDGYVRMVNRKHFDRVMGLIDPAKVVFGGRSDPKTLKIQPTVLDNVSPEDPVMQEEIFGPVLPVLTFDRVEEALEAAGGFGAEAGREAVNLADWVSDGQKLYFPKEGEAVEEPQAQADSASGLVNINTADVAALCTLPGIGESRARDIISYREANGGFQACEDIMKVSGIKTAAYEKIKDKITVK